MSETHYFHDEEALLERLAKGLKRRSQQVVFLVGSPLSAPYRPGTPGVPGVDGVIDLIRAEFSDDTNQVALLDQALQRAVGPTAYQEAFLFLQGRRGQQTANEIIREAVLKAWTRQPPDMKNLASPDDLCRTLEMDIHGWALPNGLEALGKLIAQYPDQFGRSLLTTNFDPLTEVSIKRAGGSYFRTTLHADGNLSQTEGNGCHVIHLHGYWYGSDTLHTPRQLTQPRPRLRASLAALLRNKLVIASGYGGWDDAFTEALMEVVHDDTACPEIIWTFYNRQPAIAEALSQRLEPGMDRGRITLYSGIDCNQFFPRLYDTWSTLEPRPKTALIGRSNQVHVTNILAEQVLAKADSLVILEGDDEDRPPLIDLCIGRDQELDTLSHSHAKVVFITGIGGQGKSTVAAKYYTQCQTTAAPFSLLVWRDCKEESERFETQLAAVIEKLSKGKISGQDLAQQSVECIVALLFTSLVGMDALFVFDNVDHYVDIDKQHMFGSADIFIAALLKSSARVRAVFTCRPTVEYAPNALSIRLEGIGLGASQALFDARRASSSHAQVEAAHKLTGGHAFWLDLLAIQAAQSVPGRDLDALLSELRAGGGPIPATTLNSIWTTLREREREVLRLMAETVKPESEVAIADYLGATYHFNKVAKALRYLRALNLIVIKRRPNRPDLLELHPVIRHFIRLNFPQSDRVPYIGFITRVYKNVMVKFKLRLTQRPPLSVLQYWTQNAELDITAGKIEDAFSTLAEVAEAFLVSAYPRELARVTRLLFAKVDWVTEHGGFKQFETVFKAYSRMLSHLGETVELDALLDQYEQTVPNRDVRYVGYCESRCYSLWFRSEFSKAVEWGRRGQELLEESGADSKFNRQVQYTLALAERDAGRPEVALPVFLGGRQLAEAIDPDELDEARGHVHYGNIGRCLHFMGQTESALVCYQKSALLLERSSAQENVLNRGYGRAWIGELLAGRGELRVAYAFLRSALLLWEGAAPPKTVQVLRMIEGIVVRGGRPQIKDREIENVCIRWILGSDLGGSGEGGTGEEGGVTGSLTN